jgi:hypothetical protein
VVEGEDGYREAKDFMKMLMPSHARNVKLHKDTRPLFSRHKVDSQLDSLFSPTVTLPSGGYLVMNQTEALVAIDINSGKATREHNIEDTALKTNMEAAEEIARQLRLRDLAGLIVIDFIDMDEKRNNRNVERRLKEALKNDRARIQVGRISHFGLLEMSRQRLRQGMLEGSTRPCPHCEGTGLVRSVSSSALSVLRGIEENLMSRKPENLTVYCHPEVANYIVNDKREHLLSLETGYGVSIFVVPRERVLPWESRSSAGRSAPDCRAARPRRRSGRRRGRGRGRRGRDGSPCRGAGRRAASAPGSGRGRGTAPSPARGRNGSKDRADMKTSRPGRAAERRGRSRRSRRPSKDLPRRHDAGRAGGRRSRHVPPRPPARRHPHPPAQPNASPSTRSRSPVSRMNSRNAGSPRHPRPSPPARPAPAGGAAREK